MKTNRILFIVLTLMVVMLAGCGDSSVNSNLLGNNSNGGLVNVRGNISNVTDTAIVSFYTPEAAMKKGLTDSAVRASVCSDGIYSTETDKEGNYSITVPENTYYVIAKEGNKKAVSGRQSISARAAYTEVATITLRLTTAISGTLAFENSPASVASIPVFIENTPFMCVSDASGNFYFSGIPELIGSDSYTLMSVVNVDGTSYSGSYTCYAWTTSADIELKTTVIPAGTKTITGTVKYRSSGKNVPEKNVIAILPSGEAICTKTDNNGQFTFTVDTSVTAVDLTVDMVEYLNSNNGTMLFADDLSTDMVGTLIVDETIDGSSNKAFDWNSVYYFVLLNLEDSGNYSVIPVIEGEAETAVGMPMNHYVVSNLEPGSYSYIIFGEIENNYVGYRKSNDFSIEGGKETNMTAADYDDYFPIPYIVSETPESNFYGSTQPDFFVKIDSGITSYSVKARNEEGSIAALTVDTNNLINTDGVPTTSAGQVGTFVMWIEYELEVNGYRKQFKTREYSFTKQ